MENLSHSDISRVNTLGRRFTGFGEDDALEEARELYALCLTEEERFRVRWWWNEGCRDYVGSQRELDRMNERLIS